MSLLDGLKGKKRCRVCGSALDAKIIRVDGKLAPVENVVFNEAGDGAHEPCLAAVNDPNQEAVLWLMWRLNGMPPSGSAPTDELPDDDDDYPGQYL